VARALGKCYHKQSCEEAAAGLRTRAAQRVATGA